MPPQRHTELVISLFFQAEDGIRALIVTGVQTCALPISQDRLLYPVQANEIFIKLTTEEAARLRDAGFDFYDWGEGQARLVTSWNQSAEDIKPLAQAITAL